MGWESLIIPAISMLTGGNDAPETPQVQQSPLLQGLSDPLLAILKQRLAEVQAAQSSATTAANQQYFDQNQTAQQKPTPYTYANTGLTQNPANTSGGNTPTIAAPTAPTVAKTIKQTQQLNGGLGSLNYDLKQIASRYSKPISGFNPRIDAVGLAKEQTDLLKNKYGLNIPNIDRLGEVASRAQQYSPAALSDPNTLAIVARQSGMSPEDYKNLDSFYRSMGSLTEESLKPYLAQTEVANPEYEAAMKKYEADLKAYNSRPIPTPTPTVVPKDQTQTGQFPSTTQTAGAQNPLIAELAKLVSGQTSYQPALQTIMSQSNYPKLPADNAPKPAQPIPTPQPPAAQTIGVGGANPAPAPKLPTGGTASVTKATTNNTAPGSKWISGSRPQPNPVPQPTTPQINTQPAQSAGQTLDPAQKVQNNAQFDVAETFAANNGIFNDYNNPEFLRPKTSTDYAGQMALGTDPLETALQANFISKLDKEYLPATDIAEAQQGVKQLISAPNSSSTDIANLDAAAGRLGQSVNVGPTANETLAREQLKQRMVSGTGANLADTLYQQAMNPYNRELKDQQTQSANSLSARGLGNSTIVNNVNENLNKVYADRAKDIALGSQVEATKMNEAAIMDALNQSGALETAIKNAALAGNAQNQSGAQGQANIYTTQNNMRRSDQADKAGLLNQSVNMALQRQNADQTSLGNLTDIMTKQENRRLTNMQNQQNMWQNNVNNNANAVTQSINAANGIGVPLTSMQNQNNMAGYQQQIAGQTQMNQLLGQVGSNLFGGGSSSGSSNNVSNPFNVTIPDYKLPDAGITYSPYKPTLNKY